ncbi:hypothetical protein GE061_012592 [Apolygus lucorum]|uniref:Uncharacterized protein n=1 Tax=Apolygus lucorum TaxID=248454 RepID=A0A8S9XSR1_APOLU|nr:hypothetical protein GE061_012592 [Apolygus lucorum]
MLGARSYRKRPIFRAPSSVNSRERSVESSSSKAQSTRSIGRKRSAGDRGTISSRKSYVSEQTLDELVLPGKYLQIREWLLVLVEIFIALAAWVISERNNNVEELIRVGLTRRENAINNLYWQGWAAFGSWFAGILADSYVGHYNVALFSVAFHFTIVSIVFMEDTVKGNQKGNPYAGLVWNITAVSMFILKSTDFIRVVFGLDTMGNRSKSSIMLFIFFISWVNGHTHGGLIVNLSGHASYTIYVKLSFVTSGVCLYLYVFFLRPSTKRKYSDVSIKVLHCFFTACLMRIIQRNIKIHKKKGWLDSTEGKCDRTTIGKTKELLKLYAVLLPTIGYALVVILKFDTFYAELFKTMKSVGFFRILGKFEFTRVIELISSFLTYFLVWPLFSCLNVRKHLYLRFFGGFLAGLLAIYYASFTFRATEFLVYDGNTGYVRIYNTRETSVSVTPQDRTFSSHDYVIPEKAATMVAYPVSKITLFPVKLLYHGINVSFSMYLSVQPKHTTGYIILDPPDIIRMNGLIPIMEGPPGSNTGSFPRLYLYNAAKTLNNATITVSDVNGIYRTRRYRLLRGKMSIFQLPPGTFSFNIFEADIGATFSIQEGGIYGVLSYADVSFRSIVLDQVKPGNTASPYRLIPFGVLVGIAGTLGTVALRALCFTSAPQGLLGMSFGFLTFVEYISSFALYIGYHTWHVHVVAYTAFAYSFISTILFFLSVFIFIKYRELFDW